MLIFAAGVILGALASWLITHRYYLKAGSDQRAELDRLSNRLAPRNTLANFEKLLVDAEWRKAMIDRREVWICNNDNTYQIHEGERTREFAERWATIYPDTTASTCPIYLKIANSTVKELLFVYLDGGRIFVPLTERRPTAKGDLEFFWNVNSLAVKVCRIIGQYYIYFNLEGVAERSKVTVIQ